MHQMKGSSAVGCLLAICLVISACGSGSGSVGNAGSADPDTDSPVVSRVCFPTDDDQQGGQLRAEIEIHESAEFKERKCSEHWAYFANNQDGVSQSR